MYMDPGPQIKSLPQMLPKPHQWQEHIPEPPGNSKIVFKSKTFRRKKEGYYIWIKDSIEQEDVISTTIYILNGRSSK